MRHAPCAICGACCPPSPQVPVTRWGRLDATAPFDEYAAGGSTLEVTAAVASFLPDVVMVVDWSGLDLYRRLRQQLEEGGLAVLPPMVYLNYRVFSRTATGKDLDLVLR